MPDLLKPRSIHVDLGGSRRHVAEWGEQGAPVLLLQHGMRDHARNWDWVADKFAATHHVLAPDLRGHGDSDWSREGTYNLFDFVRDLADIVEALSLGEFDIIGHSFGGHIALRLAAILPKQVRAMIVIEGLELPIVREQRRDPTPYPQRLIHWIEQQRDLKTRTPRFYRTLEDAMSRMSEQHPTIDADTIAHLTFHGTIMQAGKGLRWKYDNATRYRAPDDAHGIDLDDILAAIRCPTLLAYGEASWVPVPPPDRLGRIQDHRLITFPGISHWVHHQARGAFLDAAAEFLTNSKPINSESK